MRRLLAKSGEDIVRLDAARAPITDADAERYLLHADGFLRVPVLVMGSLLVRGYTEDLYREALAAAG
jgi:arsenate reductase-like glutaredoxin family protein